MHEISRKIAIYLKSNISNFTLTICTPSDDHKILHFLSHFWKKKSIKHLWPWPGFEPAIIGSEAHCANHHTMATC